MLGKVTLAGLAVGIVLAVRVSREAEPRLVADSIGLTVMPRDDSGDAQQWDIRNLVMEPFSLDAASPFRATIDTPLPGERADPTGAAGPWPRDDFHLLPMSGEYTFVGDVGTVPGLEGRADATEAILGTLERLADVAGAQVPSDLRGRVRLHARRLTVSSVVFAAPGATIAAAGSYGIATGQLRLRGVVRLNAVVSRTQTGARQLLLRPPDPWLSQRGAGTRLVMDVRGTRSAPVVDLDLGAPLRGRR